TSPRTDLGHDDKIVPIGVKRLTNDLVGDMRPIKVAGVDVIDATLNGLAQHGDGCLAIFGRPEDTGPSKLHRAIAEAVHSELAELESTGLADRRCAGIAIGGHVEPPVTNLARDGCYLDHPIERDLPSR